MKNPLNSRKGQTLVEALVALSILTMGFLGVATLLTKSFQLNRITTYDTQATYLAAEGIEVVKNLIDHDVYAGLPTNDDFGFCFNRGSGYYYPIDYETTAIPGPNPCANLQYSPSFIQQASTPLYFNPAKRTFTSNAALANATPFVRKIQIIESANANGAVVDIDVRSTVTWNAGILSNSVALEDHFYSYHPL